MSFLSTRPFKKLGVVFLSGFCCVASAAAQCSLSIDQLPDVPELRGFRLGMDFDQVKTRVPQVRFGRADEHGVTRTSINPSYDPRFDQASFADVRTISLDFLDGKLTTLWIGYESSFKWNNVDDFVRGITKPLNLPPAWSPKRGGQQMRCDGFTIVVSMIAGAPSIRLSDNAADETIAMRREEAVGARESMVIGDKLSRLYYPAGCAAIESVSELNRIGFKDKGTAEQAGYKLAKACE